MTGPEPAHGTGDRTPRPGSGLERRYTDREFDLILRKAFELEERAPRRVPGRDGMTLDEMRSIAAEVGLDPAALVQAAALLPVERSGPAARALGAPAAWTYELWLDTALDETARDVLLRTIRRVLRQRGEVRRSGGLLEWKSVGRSDHITIVVASRAGRTMIELTGDRGPSLPFSILLPALIWSAIAAAIGMTTTVAGAAIVLPATAVLGAWMTARLAWRSASRRLRSRLEQLASALQSDAVRLAIGPGPEPPD